METLIGRSLRQEELDGYNRYHFVKQVLRHIEAGHIAQFVAVKRHNNLVVIRQITIGEWEIKAGACVNGYTYRLSDVINLLEKLYDTANIMCLEGEIQIDVVHTVANPDAEPDSEVNEVTTIEP